WPRSRAGTRPTSRRSCASCSRFRTSTVPPSDAPRAPPSSSGGRGPASQPGCSRPRANVPRPMGEEQRGSWQELLANAEAAYEGGTDFTLAVEEEFALLDPETLSLTNRFEDVKALAAGTDVEPHLVGELIASEVEVR